MTLKATIFRAELALADMDRHYYQTHALTIARHPSETDERMMARLLAFALNAHERLEFGRGISSDEEPDLWQRDLTGRIETWIELGQPDGKRLRQACGRADRVLVYTYGGHATDLWWEQNRASLEPLDKLRVTRFPPEAIAALCGFVQRTMQLQANIQDGAIWLSDGSDSVEIQPRTP